MLFGLDFFSKTAHSCDENCFTIIHSEIAFNKHNVFQFEISYNKLDNYFV